MNQIDLKAGIIPISTDELIYSQASYIVSNCNALHFYNQGTTNILINNARLLFPGQDWGIDGNPGEYLTKQYTLKFQDNAGTPTTTGNECCVVWKKFDINKDE